MTPTQKTIFAQLVKQAADEYSNHGCNDYVLPNTPENIEFVRAMNEALGIDNDPMVSKDGTKIYTGDSDILCYCALLLGSCD